MRVFNIFTVAMAVVSFVQNASAKTCSEWKEDASGNVSCCALSYACTDYTEGGVTLQSGTCGSGYTQTAYTKPIGSGNGTCYLCKANTCADYTEGGVTLQSSPCGSGYTQTAYTKPIGSGTGTCYKCVEDKLKTCKDYGLDPIPFFGYALEYVEKRDVVGGVCFTNSYACQCEKDTAYYIDVELYKDSSLIFQLTRDAKYEPGASGGYVVCGGLAFDKISKTGFKITNKGSIGTFTKVTQTGNTDGTAVSGIEKPFSAGYPCNDKVNDVLGGCYTNSKDYYGKKPSCGIGSEDEWSDDW